MAYRLAIFDFDGTLADSRSWVTSVFNDVAVRFAFRTLSAPEIEEMRGKSNRQIIRELGVPMWKLPLIARHMRGLAAGAADRIPLFPGMAPALLTLRDRGVRLAIASSNREDTVRRILGPEIAAAFQHFECGISLFGKAGRIRRIVRHSGVAATEAIFIGDETRDVEAAGQAGIAAGIVLWGYARPEAFADFPPLVRFAALDEMLGFLIREEEGVATPAIF